MVTLYEKINFVLIFAELPIFTIFNFRINPLNLLLLLYPVLSGNIPCLSRFVALKFVVESTRPPR